jgi:hypothetical protein
MYNTTRRDMPDHPDVLRKHLEVLAVFGRKYGEYLMARRKREIEGQSDWSPHEWAEREWELRTLDHVLKLPSKRQASRGTTKCPR